MLAERAFARGLGASCNTPVGALATLTASDVVELRAWIGLPDGSQWIADERTGKRPRLGRSWRSG